MIFKSEHHEYWRSKSPLIYEAASALATTEDKALVRLMDIRLLAVYRHLKYLLSNLNKWTDLEMVDNDLHAFVLIFNQYFLENNIDKKMLISGRSTKMVIR